MVPPYSGTQLSNKKEQSPSPGSTPRNLEHMLSEKKPDTKDHVLYNSTYVKYPDQVNHRDKKWINGC